MLQPPELTLPVSVTIPGGLSTTHQLWEVLQAAAAGATTQLAAMTAAAPGLVYAQYNYTPPIHLAVREGHEELVDWLLQRGALAPDYRTYPFGDSLLTIARDREHHHIAAMLEKFLATPERSKYQGDYGAIHYQRSDEEKAFEQAVDEEDLHLVERLLQDKPSLATDNSFFWSEGILCMPAKEGNRALVQLLMHYGATVPTLLKWAQYYYFEQYDHAAFMLQAGMDANTMSWHHVTLLHDMAQKGYTDKATLLLDYGADIDAIDEEYQSTPLGMAVRWGHTDMVHLLLDRGANPQLSGAPWSTPLAWAIKKQWTPLIAVLRAAGATH
ncbi:ankyrin repeat domain-containing protein [Paraflavitalea pollutisoli]|uniref:ankyrin repeat domain-containing protein n=1 Tax=Paraflavitalea pollutisoli TaxID=3034143 RepID=UPI0023EB8C07|nr:ankyrin repeat domain-containing protein [Paraflavitalea sp. H1-2-19X]